MTYADAIQFLCSLRVFGAKFGLETPRRLAELAGHPQGRLRFIHVAGTNGKGSTCAMLESVYRQAGLRVGLFTSPHLVSFVERIQVNRVCIPETEVARLVEEMQPWLAEFPSESHPTFFEVVTVMALRYFTEQNCDLVIWETGLGGRLDATNIVTPLASVITNIGFDHQQWLGNTLEEIAAEKAGIIKAGRPIITAATAGHGLEVITETARRVAAPLTVVTDADTCCPPLGEGSLSMLGDHQRSNAALAGATVRALAGEIPVQPEALKRGLSEARWPGRMQLVQCSGSGRMLLDGAHNADSAAALRAAFTRCFPGVQPTLILGVLSDKDWAAIARTLAPLAGRVLLVPVDSARTLAPDRLVPACRETKPAVSIEVCASLAEALERAKEEPFLLVTGSLYLVGEAISLLRIQTTARQPLNERALNEWTAMLGNARGEGRALSSSRPSRPLSPQRGEGRGEG